MLLALLCNVAIVFAQRNLSKDYSYTVSKPYKVFDANSKLYFHKNDQILAIKIDGKEIMLQKFNSKGDKIEFKSEKLYEAKTLFPKNYVVENVMEFNDKFYFFYSSWDGGNNDNEQLFVREIDFEKGEFIGENKLLIKIHGKLTGSPSSGTSIGFSPVISFGVVDKFNITVSNDKKKMLVRYRRKPEVKRDVNSFDVIGVHAYEGDLQQIWNNELKMPYTERRMDVLDYTIDRQANAYMLVKVFHDDSNSDKKKKKDKEANYHVELFRIPAGTTTIDITKIDVNDKFVNGLWMYESPADYIVCAGFYNKGKSAKAADGLMVFKVKKNGGIFDTSFHEIPIEIINQNLSAKAKKKNEKKEKKLEEEGEGEGAEMQNFVMDKIQINSDGSLVLIGEQYIMNVYYDQRGAHYSFDYNDILVTKIDAAGSLAWMKKIPKRQHGAKGLGGMSYKHMFANNNHYLLYLDNVKNFNLPYDKTPAMHGDGMGGFFTSFKINDASGESSYSSIFDIRNVDDMVMHQFAVKRILDISDDEFVIEFYKKKKEDVMMKVKMH